MGRPRLHGSETAMALLDVAEKLIEDSGEDALSIRAVATEADTTTRAVYSLYGSRAGLVAALAVKGFDTLRTEVEKLGRSANPADDLLDAGLVIRRFARQHPAVFRLIFRNTTDPYMRSHDEVREASGRALAALQTRVESVIVAAGVDFNADHATIQFRALCDGLAGLEAGGSFSSTVGDRVWTSGIEALIRGITADG